MSFLSTTENVGFTGIPQTISETSCATQYKMGVEGVSGSGDMNIFIHDSSGDEQNYIPHLNDNFFHSKFKIDPNDLYTFHDSDVIAGEITVSHTEDSFVFQDDEKCKLIDSPPKQLDEVFTPTKEIKDEVKPNVVLNGQQSFPKTAVSVKNSNISKTSNAKVSKGKNQSQLTKEQNKTNVVEDGSFVQTAKHKNILVPPNSCNTASKTNNGQATKSQKLGLETFLDVFKREQGVVEGEDIKSEPQTMPMKHVVSVPKKTPSSKTPSQSKPKRGRGPTVHEALQRIPSQSRVITLKNNCWHAPGEELYSCGPLNEQLGNLLKQDSSSDDDYMPDFELGIGPVCVEETAAETRGTRLALRRAALRRHVASVHTELRLANDLKGSKALVNLVKKELKQFHSSRLPQSTVNQLLASRRMTSLLTSRERRQLRQSGWSGGESVHTESSTCVEDRCTSTPLPCARHCLSHVTSSEQRLFASCAAVFAGGARCKQALLPLRQHTPLCAEHAWKRDNYDKLSQSSRPKKPAVARKRPRAPVRSKRPPAPEPLATVVTNSGVNNEVSVCSNSSAYDSSEETTMGALSEPEYITSANDVQELEVEVGQVPADDILDPSVLSQIPDVAFTEFFNQAEGGPFAESSELAAALEAVLDERGLDEERPLDTMDYSTYTQIVKNKIPVATSVSLELSSSAPS